MYDAYMLVFILLCLHAYSLKKSMFFFFPSLSGKFLVFTGRKCFKREVEILNNAGSIFLLFK